LIIKKYALKANTKPPSRGLLQFHVLWAWILN
jgi:hypothetical protein